MAAWRETQKRVSHSFVNHFMLGQQCPEARKIIARRQLAENQKQRGFDEGRSFGKLLDRNPPIAKNTFFAIDKGDG